MAHARSRRHYRTAEKEIVKSRGLVITEEKKKHLIICGVALLVVAFTKGFIFGRLSK